MKLNVDGALLFNQNKMEIGLILRDANGETQMEASIPKEGICELAEVELVAIMRGLQLCACLGINKLILESDCLFMLQECMSNTISYTELGSLVIEIKNIQANQPIFYEDNKLQHVFREHNKPTHLLARNA